MAAKKGPPIPQMSEMHRVKIQNSNILNALVEHVEGKREMSASQVSAGLGLLKKVMPDLASTTIEAEVTHGVSDTLAALLTDIAGAGKKITDR